MGSYSSKAPGRSFSIGMVRQNSAPLGGKIRQEKPPSWRGMACSTRRESKLLFPGVVTGGPPRAGQCSTKEPLTVS